MLKPFDKQEDIPEALREHYSKREDGKWHVDISNDHPTVKHNAKLLSEKTAAEEKATSLQSDLDSSRANHLPRGHVAIAKADAELLEKVKPHGTAEEIVTKLTEHKDLKESADKRKREDDLRAVAKELGYENVEAFVRLPGLPEFEIREASGKKTVIAKLKDDKGVITEKDGKEFIESSSDLSPFLPALKASGGTKVHGSTATPTNDGKDAFAWAKEFAKNYSETSQPTTDLAKSFGIAQ